MLKGARLKKSEYAYFIYLNVYLLGNAWADRNCMLVGLLSALLYV